MTTIKTAAETRKQLIDSGVPESVAETIVAKGAAARHQDRVRRAHAAAYAAACAINGDDEEMLYVKAVLLAAELVGHGGPAGLGGPGRASARAWWASGLGKGRFSANDGGAWNSALTQALCETLEGLTSPTLLMEALGTVVCNNPSDAILAAEMAALGTRICAIIAGYPCDDDADYLSVVRRVLGLDKGGFVPMAELVFAWGGLLPQIAQYTAEANRICSIVFENEAAERERGERW